MSSRWRWGLLVLLCLVQWALPLGMAQRVVQTLDEGTAYRFRTAPVDPADPFRGRYVVLDFEVARMQGVPPSWPFERGARVYAPVRVGADGFAVLERPLGEPPAQGDWLAVRVQWRHEGEVRLALPFDRYYLDEQLAPEAERLYAQRQRVGESEASAATYASVRIRKGTALIEELYIDDVPVRAAVKAAVVQP